MVRVFTPHVTLQSPARVTAQAAGSDTGQAGSGEDFENQGFFGAGNPVRTGDLPLQAIICRYNFSI